MLEQKAKAGCCFVTTGLVLQFINWCEFSLDRFNSVILSQTSFSKSDDKKTKKRQIGVQEINIIDIVKPITKFSKMITDANSINFYLEKAYAITTSGRPGPVFGYSC